MFPNTSIDELTGDAIYHFASRTSVYLQLLKYYEALFDKPYAVEEWHRGDVDHHNENFWWVVNEAWAQYGTVNPDVPLRWLALSKRALHWNHMPSNFHPWALQILSRFDLPRYQAAYQMAADEYEAVARDLPLVLEGLRNYPLDKLAPPIDENNWGQTDQ
jgi:hypothetical protein